MTRIEKEVIKRYEKGANNNEYDIRYFVKHYDIASLYINSPHPIGVDQNMKAIKFFGKQYFKANGELRKHKNINLRIAKILDENKRRSHINFWLVGVVVISNGYWQINLPLYDFRIENEVLFTYYYWQGKCYLLDDTPPTTTYISWLYF